MVNHHLEQTAISLYLEQIANRGERILSDLCDFKNGKTKPKNSGSIPIYGGNGILGYTDETNSDNVVIIGRVGAYCGNVFLEPSKCWISDNAIQSKSKICDDQFYDYLMLQDLELGKNRTGSGQPLLKQQTLNSITTKALENDEIIKFNHNIKPVFEKIQYNEYENKLFREVRDTLLPKLLSGEITID